MIVKPNDQRIIDYVKNKSNQARPRGNQAGRRAIYKDIYAAFDIETTNYIKDGKLYNFMYSWALQLDEDYTIIGRRWDEFYTLKNKLKAILKGITIVVFVHNLKYEFQYLKPLGFAPEDVIASEKREVIKAYSEPFEFRCSYKLTDLSLDKLTENVKHHKKSGEEFNYNIVRYPWTELTKKEIEYIQNDVLGLVEAIKQRNKLFNDSLYTMPITLTGYVRRQARKIMRSVNRNAIEKIKLNEEQYKMHAGAFRGGNNIANPYYINETIPNVAMVDESSAHPARILLNKMPVGDWQEIKDCTPEKLLKYIYLRKRAVICQVRFNNIKLKDSTNPAPYIPENKCIIRGKKDCIFNRVLKAEQIELYITDLDFKIILEEYDFESFDVVKAIKCRYGMLPEQLREFVAELYKNKTSKKGIDPEGYGIAKILINAIFGLMAQNPAKEKIYYCDGVFEVGNAGAAANIEQFNKTAFFSYAYGVYISAWSRVYLQEMIRAVGKDAFIYCDTDGVYFIEKYANWNAINKLIKETEKAGEKYAAVDPDGVIHYPGAWELKRGIKKFRTAGQKKYAWEDAAGVHIATAGVHKDKGGKELGEVDRFEEGFIFKDAGGNEAIYNDFPEEKYIVIDDKEIEITPYIFIRPREYKLGVYTEYREQFLYPEYWLKNIKDRGHNRKEYIFK